MGVHWQELIVILVIVLVLFGPKRLPEIGTSMGRSIRGFRDSMNGRDDETAPGSTTARTSGPHLDAAVGTPAPVAVEVVDTTATARDTQR